MPFTTAEIVNKLQGKIASCKSKGVKFTVPLEELLPMFAEQVCKYTGVKFKHITHITFERINPFLDYVEGNVVLVTEPANAHKSLLDNFVKTSVIPDEMKIKLMRKAIYVLEKRIRGKV